MRTAILFLLVLWPSLSMAAMPTASFLSADHAEPAWFLSDNNGGFYGKTTIGETFTQTPILTHTVVKLHRFDIGQHHFYISDKGAFRAESDLAALSVYFTLS